MRRAPLFVAAALALAACGDSDATPHMSGTHMGGDSPSAVAPGARRIEVTARSFSFDPDEITVEAGEDVALVLTSKDVLHDLIIDDLDAHVTAGTGKTAEGGLRADEPGRYAYYCSVPGHRTSGMEGTLVVE